MFKTLRTVYLFGYILLNIMVLEKQNSVLILDLNKICNLLLFQFYYGFNRILEVNLKPKHLQNFGNGQMHFMCYIFDSQVEFWDTTTRMLKLTCPAILEAQVNFSEVILHL